jgi:hypothetical protein
MAYVQNTDCKKGDFGRTKPPSAKLAIGNAGDQSCVAALIASGRRRPPFCRLDRRA